MKIGQLCIKIAGRDSGQFCLIVDNIDNNFVLIDGNVRRKKCNVLHLEPLNIILKIKKGADTKTVLDAMKKEGIEVFEKKPKKEKKKPLEKPLGKEIQKTPVKETKKVEEKPAKKEAKKHLGKKEASAKAEKKKK